MTADTPRLSYKDAGVDIDAGEAAVNRIKKLAKATHGPEVLSGLGGFGGLFQFPAANYKEPVLVSSADGVGTKLKIAFMTGIHTTVGQDIVNHCVDDILTTGARPLFFLDYFASGRLDGAVFEDVIAGISKACRENSCSLVGGETAEMPDFYQDGEYDISGTIVGASEKSSLLAYRSVEKGDVLIGLPSTGLHTNGYSLARKALFREWTVDTHLDELGTTIGDALLAIHRSYLHVTSGILDEPWLHAMGHITGGGLIGNLTRVLQTGQSLAVDWDAWDWPAIFKVIQKAGNIDTDEMRGAFNLGMGWVYIVSKDAVNQIESYLNSKAEPFTILGEVR